MSTTTLPDEPDPIRVTLTADVGDYLEQMRRATIATCVAGGMTEAEAEAWLEQAEREPTSEEAMRFYRQRHVLGEDDLPTADEIRAGRDAADAWLAPEQIDALADFVEDAERRSIFRRTWLDRPIVTDPAEEDGDRA